MNTELWKPVKGYENYQVSTYGRVKSLERYEKCGNFFRIRKEKILKCNKNKFGYFKVDLYKNGVKKTVRINRLVWQTFVGEIPPKWDINHLDENKENNHLENLEACSHEKNINWGTRNAKAAVALSKAVEAIDKVTGRVVFTFPSTNEAGRQGFHQGNIAACCRGKRKSHGGFIWRYA